MTVRDLASASAPASSGNLGPGFDVLGLALDLRCVVGAQPADRMTVDDGDGPIELGPQDMLFDAVMATTGRPMALTVENTIPRTRGLGSSAAVTAAAAAAAVRAVGREPVREEIYELVAGIEGHGDNAAPVVRHADELAEGWPGLAGLAVNHGDRTSSFPMGPVTEVVRGPSTFSAPLPAAQGRPRTFEVPAAGFFQVAPSALGAVHDLMAAHLAGAGTLVDLYCGVGVHGLVLASRADPTIPVAGIDSSEPLVAAARVNAERMGVTAHYEVGPVEGRLRDVLQTTQATRIVLNPGRSGCRPL